MSITTLATLIGIQIFMGALDTFLHHEFREKLAWQPTARAELRLHALRNLIYAGLFMVLAWSEPRGLFAHIVLAFIILEVLITLWDFVEEDLSRKLPASERILHTLLTLNYGAILIIIMPLLLIYGRLPTEIVSKDYGVISAFLTLAALGVLLFALRDYFAARRLNLLKTSAPATLANALKGHKHILITGATGFIGQRVANALIESGHSVTVRTRAPEKVGKLFKTPVRIISDFNEIRDDAALDAVVNLAGEPLATGLWTQGKRAKIINSRQRMAAEIEELCERLYVPPKTLVTASAIGWYGLRGEETLTEQSQPKTCFTHQVCDSAETAADSMARFQCRIVKLRLGLVLGLEGGMLANLLVPFEYGLGGPMGDGEHWMSWIERDDAVRLIIHALATPDLEGPVNAVAPNPVRNSAFVKALGAALNRPAILPMSAVLLKFVLGDFAKELLLASQKVVPEKAVQSGFTFNCPTLEAALEKILPIRNNGQGQDQMSSRTYHLSERDQLR